MNIREYVASLSPERRTRLLLRMFRPIAEGRKQERKRYDWLAAARAPQIMPGEPGSASPRRDWRNWLVMAGRGFGKSRTGAEAVRSLVKQGRARSIAFIAPTLRGARRLMIENPFSGILAVTPRKDRPIFKKADKELHWPNGAIGYIFTSEEPDDIRGFNGDLAWCEEPGAWKYPNDTWSNLQMGLRVKGPMGDRARAILTTTPRPIELLKKLVVNPATVITGGTTYDNAENLDPETLKEFVEQYEGTRLGRQELLAELLSDTPGALWTMAMIDALRVKFAPEFKRLVVGVDPAVKEVGGAKDGEEDQDDRGAETGIISAGIAPCRCKGGEPEDHLFVVRDSTGRYTPKEWAEKVAFDYSDLKADRVVAEINNGGALVESNIKTLGDSRISYRGVSAARGKQTRAEPIASFYEQGKAHHVGSLPKLEDQMTTWQPMKAKKSPDRVDAMVWSATDLMLGGAEAKFAKPRTPAQRRW